jgi:FAD/FMN-containing dehydrogenase
MLASFSTNEDACAAVSAIFRAGVVPSALEFMERRGIEWVIEHDGITFDLKDGIGAFLLIEADGTNQDVIFADCEKINEVLEQHNCRMYFRRFIGTKRRALAHQAYHGGIGKIKLGLQRGRYRCAPCRFAATDKRH